MTEQRPQQAIMVLVTVVTMNGTRYHVYREERSEKQTVADRRYSCPCCGGPTKQEYLLCGRCLYV